MTRKVSLPDLREMIESKAAETTLADSQYDYGHVNGWLDALHWAEEIDSPALYDLRNVAKVAFESAVSDLQAG